MAVRSEAATADERDVSNPIKTTTRIGPTPIHVRPATPLVVTAGTAKIRIKLVEAF